MKTQFQPMLAASMKAEKGQTVETLDYPLLVSDKLDGIRCVIHGGKVLSRRMKPIPNLHIQRVLGGMAGVLEGCDGELMIPGTFQDVTSGIMSEDGEPDFVFKVFDNFTHPLTPYYLRVDAYHRNTRRLGSEYVEAVSVGQVGTPEELDGMLERALTAGLEGLIVRHAQGPYKFGRATWREQWMTKIKPFEDAEATVIGFEEQEHNGNNAKQDAFGRTERSSHKANKTGKGTLGSLVVVNKEFGVFKVGTGLDDAVRVGIWSNRNAYLGKTLTFKFQRIGMKDKPRIPVFKGFRQD